MNIADEIAKLFGDKKQAFINDLVSAINSYLSSKWWRAWFLILKKQ